MKFDHVCHGFYLPASLPVPCSCRECDGGKTIRKAAMKNIGHSAAVVCGTKNDKTDRYPPFGGVWVCSVVSGGTRPCMELNPQPSCGQIRAARQVGLKIQTPNRLCFATSRASLSPSRPPRRSATSPDARAAPSRHGSPVSMSRPRESYRSSLPRSCGASPDCEAA